MVKQKRVANDTCPVSRSLDVIGDRWSMLIVRNAFDGMRRFSDFQRDLGVARNILADRLRRLSSAGIVAIQPASDGSSYQEYVLTAKGERLFPLIVALRQWGEKYLFDTGEEHSRLVENSSGKPLRLMLPVAPDGRVVLPSETRVKRSRTIQR